MLAQQPLTHYPYRRELPFPIEQFIRRDRELAAWTAEVDGHPVGHVCVQRPEGSVSACLMLDDEVTPAWVQGHNRPVDELATVSALFVDLSQRGSGLGGRLLDVAVDEIRSRGLGPCLDVIQGYSPAPLIYQKRGWRVVGTARPPWLDQADAPVLAMVLPG
nr:GNAT family N-acetyltransferase [Arsenicicoccus piscis]